MSDIIFNHQAIHSPYHDVRKVQKEIKPGSDPENRRQSLSNHISLTRGMWLHVIMLLHAALYPVPITVEKYLIPFWIPACTQSYIWICFFWHSHTDIKWIEEKQTGTIHKDKLVQQTILQLSAHYMHVLTAIVHKTVQNATMPGILMYRALLLNWKKKL